MREKMKEDKSRVYVQVLTEEIDQLLMHHGFLSIAGTESIGDSRCNRWTRNNGWKTDAVLFYFSNRHVDSVDPHVQVLLPLPQDMTPGFDDRNVRKLAGHDISPYYFPKIAGTIIMFRCRAFVEEVVRDTERCLPWFDETSTPEKCLARLERGEAMCAPGSPRYESVKAYLSSLLKPLQQH